VLVLVLLVLVVLVVLVVGDGIQTRSASRDERDKTGTYIRSQLHVGQGWRRRGIDG